MIRAVSTLLVLAGWVAAADLWAQTVDTLEAVPLSVAGFHDARSVGVDPFGALYVADAGRDVVVKMDGLGRLLATLGGPGSREGEFDDPSGLDPTNGMVLYVADSGNHRIQIFSRSFAYLGAIPLARSDQRSSAGVTYRRQDGEGMAFASGDPIDVGASSSNDIFAIDADRRAVLAWNENRRFSRIIGSVDGGRGALLEPVSVWTGEGATLYVADRGAGSVVVFDQYGTFIRSLGAGLLADLRAVTYAGGRVVAALPRALVLFDEAGRSERRIEIRIPEEIVDVAAGRDGTLYVLSGVRLYRLHAAP